MPFTPRRGLRFDHYAWAVLARAFGWIRHSAVAAVVAWVLSRAVMLWQLNGNTQDFLPDVRLYATWTILLADRQFPVGDAYWQYPPGAGVLFYLTHFLGPDPVNGFVALAIAADLGLLVMLLVVGHRRHDVGSTNAAWLWVIGGLAVGPIMMARFDIFPTVFAAAAVLAAARPWRSGVWAGIGALLKVWPILMLATVSRRQLPKAALSAIVTIGVGLAAINVWATGGFSFLGQQGGRGLQIESVGSIGYVISGMLGKPVDIVLRYGAFEFQEPQAERIGLLITVIGLALFCAIGILRLSGRLEQLTPGDIGLTLILIAVATSRVYSPQYDVWVMGMAATCLVDRRTRMIPVVWTVVALCALTSLIFPWLYGSLLHLYPLASSMQVLRIALLLVCTVWALIIVFRSARSRTVLPAS